MEVQIGQYKQFKTGSLKGTFTLIIPAWGKIKIHNCKHFVSTFNNSWFHFPDEKGKVGEDGKTQYFKLIYILDKTVEKDLQESVLKAIAEYQKNEETNGAQDQAHTGEDGLLLGEAPELW